MKIKQAWESKRDSFVELPRAEFDELAQSDKFVKGPLRTEHSRFMQEFGPYSPEQWAFGELEDGKRVCVKI